MASPKLNSKLKSLISQNALTNNKENEIFSTCIEYIKELPKKKKLDFILKESLHENAKPANMTNSLFRKVVDEVFGFNPFSVENWTCDDLENFIWSYFGYYKQESLDDLLTTKSSNSSIVHEIETKLVDKDKVYSIAFDYHTRLSNGQFSPAFFLGYIMFGSDGKYHTLEIDDESLQMEIDRYNLPEIINLYLQG